MTADTETNSAVRSDRDQVAALARGLAVMRAFSEQNARLTLSDVARLVNLPRASVRRSLLTLQTLGYVESNGRYFALSPQVLTSGAGLSLVQPDAARGAALSGEGQ